MAFPQVAAETSGVLSSNGTTVTMTYPAGIVAGSPLIALVSLDGIPATTLAGWTKLLDLPNGTQHKLLIAFLRAASALSGTFDLTLDVVEQAAWRVMRISGLHATQDPVLAATTAEGNTVSPDPPSLTHGWGGGAGEDTLWVATFGQNDGRDTQSAFPTGYTDRGYVTSGGTQGAALGCATRELVAATEDPAAFTISTSRAWLAQTIALRAAAAAPPPATSINPSGRRPAARRHAA